MLMLWIIFLIIAYLLGSLSSAIIICKLLNYPDPRTEGSLNPGATNVLRIAGKGIAALVLTGDVLKGLIAVSLALLFGIKGAQLGFIALAAVLGHMYPLFFQFKGGKGVATALGSLLGLSFLLTLLILAVWSAVVLTTRYVSLGAISSAIAAPFLTLLIGQSYYFLPIAIISLLIIWRHYDNIMRLKAGTEGKTYFK